MMVYRLSDERLLTPVLHVHNGVHYLSTTTTTLCLVDFIYIVTAVHFIYSIYYRSFNPKWLKLEENKVPKKDETEEGKNEDVNELKVYGHEILVQVCYLYN